MALKASIIFSTSYLMLGVINQHFTFSYGYIAH